MRPSLLRILAPVLALAVACVAAETPAVPGDSAAGRRPARTDAAASPRDRGPSAPASFAARALVTRTIDGDTIEVRFRSRLEPVRLIGVDTPEHGTQGFDEATAFTRDAAPAGATVWLEVGVEERDRYGRLLAYVWLRRPGARGEAHVRAGMLNARLLLRGMAVLLTIPPNVEYVDLFTRFQRAARVADAGLWDRTPVRPAVGRGCDPSYPDECIPPPPPDLDCGEIAHRNFRVVGDDPHGFDDDGDGRGCES